MAAVDGSADCDVPAWLLCSPCSVTPDGRSLQATRQTVRPSSVVSSGAEDRLQLPVFNRSLIRSGSPARTQLKSSLAPSHHATLEVKYVGDVIFHKGLLGEPGAAAVKAVEDHARCLS